MSFPILTRLGILANQSIDFLYKIEQILELGHLVLADHFLGYVNSKCLSAAVQLRIRDILESEGRLSLLELSKASGACADRLGQILRVLYNNGVFQFDAGHETYILRYCPRHPASVKKNAVRWPAQINYDTNDNMFIYFQKQGWVPQLHHTLGGGATAQAPAPGIVADYPLKEVADETVIDIGGGGGALIAPLLRAKKNMQGGVFDLLNVIDHITLFFHNADGRYYDLHDRVRIENLTSGNAFEQVPRSKVHTIKWCLYDWKDDKCLEILKNIRKSIISGPNSRLVIMESILEDGHSSRVSRYADINMMMTVNGKGRTEAQWRLLAAKSGSDIENIYNFRNAWPKAIDLRPIVEAKQETMRTV